MQGKLPYFLLCFGLTRSFRKLPRNLLPRPHWDAPSSKAYFMAFKTRVEKFQDKVILEKITKITNRSAPA